MVGIRARVLVADVMTRDLVTLSETSTAKEVAIAMSGKSVGSVVITKEGHPSGIITEKDIVERVIARGRDPERTLARDIMSSPVSVIDPRADAMEAARKMAKLGIRRLVVVDKGKMVGIVTSRDILSTAPELMEVLADAAKNRIMPSKRGESLAGFCDNCEEWSESLEEVNGHFLCEVCRNDMEP
ncbi:MAG: CBS domain-containing protein [Candidatus Verstraetearchaeota archaeon]|nr:CBS domain-containing protein [Candidatus Verstraetearchaeota archaeon]